MTGTPQSPADILRAARKLIEKPEAWTQRVFARDIRGKPTDARSKDAVCWCMTGAVIRVGGDHHGPELSFLRKAVKGIPEQYNDDSLRSHAQVLKRFDRAIALAERG